MREDLRSIWHNPTLLWQAITVLDGYLGSMSTRDVSTLKPCVLPLTQLLDVAPDAKGIWQIDELIPQSIVGRLFNSIEDPLKRILRQPQQKLERYHAQRHPSRAKELDQSCMMWLAQQPGRTMREKLRMQDRIKTVERHHTNELPQNALAMTMVRTFGELFAERCPIMSDSQRESLRTALFHSPLVELRALPPTQPNNTLISHVDYSKLWRAWQQWRRLDERFSQLHDKTQLLKLIEQSVFWTMSARLFRKYSLAVLDLPVRVDGVDECESFCEVSSWIDGCWKKLERLDFAILSSNKAHSGEAKVITVELDVNNHAIRFIYKGKIRESFSLLSIHTDEDIPSIEDIEIHVKSACDFVDKHMRSFSIAERTTKHSVQMTTPELLFATNETLSGVSHGELAWRILAQSATHQKLGGGSNLSWITRLPHVPAFTEDVVTQSLLDPINIARLKEVSLEAAYPISTRQLKMHVVRPDMVSRVREAALTHVARQMAHDLISIPLSVAWCVGRQLAHKDASTPRNALYFVLDVEGDLLSITPLFWKKEKGEAYWERHSSLAPSEQDDLATTRAFKQLLIERLLPSLNEWRSDWIQRESCVERLLTILSLREFIEYREFTFPIATKEEQTTWRTLKFNQEIFDTVTKDWLKDVKRVFNEWIKHDTWERLRKEGSQQQPVILWHGEIFEYIEEKPAWMRFNEEQAILYKGASEVKRKLLDGETVWKDWLPALSLEVVIKHTPHCRQLVHGGINLLDHARQVDFLLKFPPYVEHMALFFWLGDGANIPLDRDIAVKRHDKAINKELSVEIRLKWEPKAAMRDFDISILKGTCTLTSHPIDLPQALLPPALTLSRQGINAYKRLANFIQPHNWEAEPVDIFNGSIEGLFMLLWETGGFFEEPSSELQKLLSNLEREHHQMQRESALYSYTRYLLTLAHFNYADSASLYDDLLTLFQRHNWLDRCENWRGQESWRWDIRALALSWASQNEQECARGTSCLLHLLSHANGSVRNTAAQALGLALMRDDTLADEFINDPIRIKKLLSLTEQNLRKILSRLPDMKEDARLLLSPLENLAYWCIILEHETAMTHELLRPGASALRPIGRMLRRIDSMIHEKDFALRRPSDALRLPQIPNHVRQSTPLLYHLQQRMLGPCNAPLW